MTFETCVRAARPLAFLGLGLGLLSGCSNIFFADFESDTVGENPQTPPPGLPLGDAIDVNDGEALGGLSDVYVTNLSTLDGARSLRIDGPTGGLTPVVIFIPTDRPDASKPLTFDYSGRFLEDGTIRLCVSGLNGLCSFLVRLMDGDVVVNDVVVGSYEPLGTHRVIFTLFPALDRYSFAMLGDANVPENLAGDLPHASNIPDEDLNLSVRFEDAGLSDSYLMDNIRISVRN